MTKYITVVHRKREREGKGRIKEESERETLSLTAHISDFKFVAIPLQPI